VEYYSFVKRAWAVGLLALAACHGPVLLDYEAQTGERPGEGLNEYRELKFPDLASAPRGSARRFAFERLRQACELANRFIDSEWNRYFPRGRRFSLTRDGHFRLDSAAGDGFDVRLWVTRWGTMINELGFSAQETADGFVVGRCEGTRGQRVDATVANTLFFTLDGEWRDPAGIAALVLHEMSHTLQVRAQGQLSYWMQYYLEAVVLMRGGSETNELEKIPYRVEIEFWKWVAARA
jgi:hypothetical protein